MTPNPIRLRHVWTPITNQKKSFALMSAANASSIERAVVFVHGFSGNAKTTWSDFLSLVDDDATATRWWENADLYFYHYYWNSIFQRIGYNSDQLFKFLNRIFPQPEPGFFQTAEMSLRPGFQYKELTLVGHSEGGLLLRKVVLEAANRERALQNYVRSKASNPAAVQPNPTGLLVAQLRLFAPAIGGEALSGLLGVISSLPVISSVLRSSSAKQGLGATAEPVRAARDYTNYWAQQVTMECFQADILWAEHDSIVDREKYQFDHHCTNSPPGTDHSSVCKPKKDYLLPIEFAEKGVNSASC